MSHSSQSCSHTKSRSMVVYSTESGCNTGQPMKTILTRVNVFYLLFGGALFFLFISWEYAVSNCIFLMTLLFFVDWDWDGKRFGLRKGLGAEFILALRDPLLWMAMVPFLLVAVSSLWTVDTEYLLKRLQVKVPFFLMPLAFSGLPCRTDKCYRDIHLILIVLVSMVSVSVLVQFGMDPDFYLDKLGRGQTLPTPSNHIRFSMAAALAACAGFYLLTHHRAHFRKSVYMMLIVMTVFLFFFIHILAVRTGLICLYFGLVLWVVFAFIQKKRRRLAGGIVMLMFFMPVAAYFLLPSVKTKLDYMRWSIGEMRQSDGMDTADSDRIFSIKVGWDIFKEHPLLGVGAGDVRQEVRARYALLAPDRQVIIPHNQWVIILAGTGILGGIVFLGAFIWLLLSRRQYRIYLFTLLSGIYFMSYFVEPTIENNFGIILLLLFQLPGIWQTDGVQRGTI